MADVLRTLELISSVAKRDEQENTAPNAFTSPRKLRSGERPRKPPTVTPKRFSRFFTPRASLSSRDSRQTRAKQQLKDITRHAVNSCYRDALSQDFPSSRPLKRRRYVEETLSSPPQSSPIRYQPQPVPSEVHIFEDTESCFSSDEEADLPTLPVVTQPVRRLQQWTSSYQLLTRSFGQPQSYRQEYASSDSTAIAYSGTANFCSRPQDVLDWRRPQVSLPFSSAPCNTNSLVAVGSENGLVHLLDTADTADFSRPHISFKAHENAVMDLTFSPCDYLLATAGGDNTCRVVDMQTQQLLSVFAGHRCSVKQIRFRPDNTKLLTSSGRDGIINIWDLRCSERAVQALNLGPAGMDEDSPLPANLHAYASMLCGPAHRAARAASQITRVPDLDDAYSTHGTSITSIQHLPGSRSHLLLSAAEGNSALKLFDLRVAGRNTKSDRFGYEIPVTTTQPPPTQRRHYGVSSLSLSTDGSRVYSLCRDDTIWVYSTQHLILGSAPESVNLPRRTRLAPPEAQREGLGPLYGLRNPALRVSSFYIRAALRRATPQHDELLAVGSQDKCALVFSTDERVLRSQARIAKQDRRIARPAWLNSTTEEDPVEIFENVGTALVRGHSRDVNAIAFAYDGKLVTNSDDLTARRWREDATHAQGLRQCGEGEGLRWCCGWADVPSSYDEDD